MSESYSLFGGNHYTVLIEENTLRSAHPNSQCTTQVYGQQKQQKMSYLHPSSGAWHGHPNVQKTLFFSRKSPFTVISVGGEPQTQSGCWKMGRSLRLGMKEGRALVTGEERGTLGVTWDTQTWPAARPGHPLSCSQPGAVLGAVSPRPVGHGRERSRGGNSQGPCGVGITASTV